MEVTFENKKGFLMASVNHAVKTNYGTVNVTTMISLVAISMETLYVSAISMYDDKVIIAYEDNETHKDVYYNYGGIDNFIKTKLLPHIETEIQDLENNNTEFMSLADILNIEMP